MGFPSAQLESRTATIHEIRTFRMLKIVGSPDQSRAERQMKMNSPNVVLSRQSQRLCQTGAAFFAFSALEGFAIPVLPSPRLGLSVHTLSALEGCVSLCLGLAWPRLRLSARASWMAFWTYLYSSFVTIIPYTMAAIWGAGNSTIPLAAGTARGTRTQESVIKIVLYSAAPTFLFSIALILWGLRDDGA